jgi:hypothetical protein
MHTIISIALVDPGDQCEGLRSGSVNCTGPVYPGERKGYPYAC